jgi:hypothetical protein
MIDWLAAQILLDDFIAPHAHFPFRFRVFVPAGFAVLSADWPASLRGPLRGRAGFSAGGSQGSRLLLLLEMSQVVFVSIQGRLRLFLPIFTFEFCFYFFAWPEVVDKLKPVVYLVSLNPANQIKSDPASDPPAVRKSTLKLEELFHLQILMLMS